MSQRSRTHGTCSSRSDSGRTGAAREGDPMSQVADRSLEFWAARQPDALAVIAGTRTMTYGQWNDAANRVAESLASHGVAPGDRIGMRFRVTPEWFIVHRALGKLGVEQVTVNWRLTPSEAMYILEDSGCRGLACDDRDVSGWAELGVPLLLTVGQDLEAAGLRYEDALVSEDAPARSGPVRPALIVYTSGTTGKPKGVPPLDLERVDLEQVARYQRSVLAVPPLPEGVRTLLSLPVHHGLGAAIACATCELGGSVTVMDPFDPREALRLIEEHRIQSWTAVPTMLLRVQALAPDELDRYDLSSLVAVLVGAAAVPYALKTWIIDRLGATVLWEAYGCSEAGMLTYMPPEDQARKPGSSGIPYDEVKIRILDGDGRERPSGETGEIAVWTPVLFDRYLGRDRLGSDTLSDDGFYSTGDVGHLDEDGHLFITDRIKDMIVTGGTNIYPAEVEAALVEHPQITGAAVIGVPHDDLGEQTMAFIIQRGGADLTGEQILTYLDGRLARYKLPRLFEFVDELPMSPIGKVIKTALREPFWAGRERSV